MLSNIRSPALCSILFTDIQWASSWNVDEEGWLALDSSLADLSKTRPGLRIIFGFSSWDSLHPNNEETLLLVEVIRRYLPLFLAHKGWAEVIVTYDATNGIYQDRSTRL